MHRKLTLVTSLVVVTSFGCAAQEPPPQTEETPVVEDDRRGGKEDSYYACGFVEYPDESGFPGHSLTSQRVQALTQYANELLACTQPALDNTFARRGVTTKPIAEQYEIRVEGDDCFTDTERWGYNDDLDSDDDLTKMQQQVRSTVSFLRSFHEDMNGYPNRMFDVVTLCPDTIVGNRMRLEGRQLYIGVNRGAVLGGLKPHNALDIRGDWAGGEHLEEHYGLLSKLWFVIDPVGTPRLALRDAIGRAADRLADLLRGSRDKPEGELREDMRRMIRDHVHDDFEMDEDGADFKQRALVDIEEMSADELRTVADNWADFIDQPDHQEAMNNAAGSVHEAAARNAINLDVEQWGLFVFANFHDINVSADFFFPAEREFVRYVKLEQIDWDVNVKQYGLIAIWTSDNVDVKVNVTIDRGLETAGLERAMGSVR